MKIKFIRNTCYKQQSVYEGSVLDIPLEDAQFFLAIRKAIKYDEAQVEKETSTGLLPSIEWNPRKKYKVVMLSWRDYAGSGWHRAQSVNILNEYDVKLVCNLSHPFGYPRDLSIDNDPDRLALAQKLIDECDIIHFKGDDLPQPEMWGLNITTKRMCITVGGSSFRRKKYYDSEIMISSSFEKSPIEEYLQIPIRTAVSCDLLYPEYKGSWTPNIIDTCRNPYTWTMPHDSPIIIGTTPSHSSQDLKGTNDIFLPAVEMLRKKGYKIETRIVSGVDNKTCLTEKQKFTMFFDQGKVGFWGMSAVESAAYGIPVVVHIPDWVKEFAKDDLQDCPFLMFDSPTPESCADAIERGLSGNLAILSLETKRYATNKLGYLFAANQWNELYKQVIDSKPVALRGGIVHGKYKRVLLYQYRPAIRLWKWANVLKRNAVEADIAYAERYEGMLIKGLDFSSFKMRPISEYDISKYDAIIGFNPKLVDLPFNNNLYIAVGDIKSTKDKMEIYEEQSFLSCKYAWFVSEEQRQQAIALFPRLDSISAVIINGVVNELLPQELKSKIGGRKLNVVWHGTLSADKENHRYLVEKFRNIASRCNLHIYPSELGCPDEYKSIGAIIHETVLPLDLIAEISQYDAGLITWATQIPGTDCSLPNKLFEYLSAGLPVISDKYPAIEKFADGKSCIFWTDENPYSKRLKIRRIKNAAESAIFYESQVGAILAKIDRKPTI